MKTSSWVVACAMALAIVASVSRGKEPEAASTSSSPAKAESRATTFYLRNTGGRVRGWIAIHVKDTVERRYVPKDGLGYSVSADNIVLRYVNVITKTRKPLWSGEKTIVALEQLGKETVIDLTRVNGRMVTIKAIAEDGRPLANTRLEVRELWDGHEVSVAGGNTDSTGTIRFYLADDNVYKARVRWKYSPVTSESKSFKPKDLEKSQFTFTPLPPEASSFSLHFVIAEGDRRRPATEVRGVELLSDKQGVLAAAYDGRVLIRLDDNEDFRVKPGDKIRLRLGSEKYEIREPVVTVGKEGTSIEVELVPIRKAVLEWKVTAEGRADKEPVDATIHIKPADEGNWLRRSSSRRWECEYGKYEITAFAYGYRLYRGKIDVTMPHQTIPIRLTAADKCAVIVTLDKAGQRDVKVRVVYPRNNIGLSETRRLLKDGKGDVYYDGKEQAGLLVYAVGYGPMLVRLEGKTSESHVSLKAADPLKVMIERNDVVKDIRASLLTRLKIVSAKPWRHVIARIVDGRVTLNTGEYIPIIDLAVKGVPVSLFGKVVECEPVCVEVDTKSITVRPRRIVTLDDVLKAKLSK